MKSFLENKQLIHIVAEVLALVCVIVFVSQKTKKIMGHINDLAQRVEDQEDMIHKHEQEIQELKNIISKLQTSQKHNNESLKRENPPKKTQFQNMPSVFPSIPSIIVETMSAGSNFKPRQSSSKVEEVNEDPVKEETTVSSKTVDVVTETVEDSDSDIDRELTEELNDLEREHTLD